MEIEHVPEADRRSDRTGRFMSTTFLKGDTEFGAIRAKTADNDQDSESPDSPLWSIRVHPRRTEELVMRVVSPATRLRQNLSELPEAARASDRRSDHRRN